MIASAPGKLIVLGEYAVLDGAEALVLAVDRRAICVRQASRPPSPFLDRAEALCAAEVGAAPYPLAVDSSSLTAGARKLGLGSSAAATVAFVAARLHLAGEPFDRDRVHRLAHRAHAEASAALGARGSGADVAASTFGGAVRVVPRDREAPPTVEQIAADAVTWIAVDTGQSANTRTLVAEIARFAERDRAAYGALIAAIAEASGRGCRALSARHGGGILDALRAGAAAIAALGARSGVELELPVHRAIEKIAKNHGGAAKPTGAAGGDAAICAFLDEAAARRFCVEAMAAGIEPLALSVEPGGVAVFPAT